MVTAVLALAIGITFSAPRLKLVVCRLLKPQCTGSAHVLPARDVRAGTVDVGRSCSRVDDKLGHVPETAGRADVSSDAGLSSFTAVAASTRGAVGTGGSATMALGLPAERGPRGIASSGSRELEVVARVWQ